MLYVLYMFKIIAFIFTMLLNLAEKEIFFSWKIYAIKDLTNP